MSAKSVLHLSDLGFSDIVVTPGSGDQGVDVMGSLNGTRYAFQCKRQPANVSNKAVQEIIAGLHYYSDCEQGIVITNSRTFTTSAIELAQSASVWLWGRETLKGLIEDRLDGIIYQTVEDLFRHYDGI